MPMNVQYPQCLGLAPVLTTIMAIKDGRCYPANGPSQEQFPIGSQNISIPLKTSSAYYNQEILQPQTLSPTHQTVFIDGEPKYHILEANKEGQHFEAFNGIAHFDTITVTAKSVTFVNVTATTFIWHTASQESYCTNCGKISLLPYNGQRFFKCSGNPTFTGVDANVLAPTCSCAFINSSVICLRDKSSPEQSYTNTDITDLTSYIEIFGPNYEVEYATGFRDIYSQELKSTATTLGIATAIGAASIFIVHPAARAFILN